MGKIDIGENLPWEKICHGKKLSGKKLPWENCMGKNYNVKNCHGKNLPWEKIAMLKKILPWEILPWEKNCYGKNLPWKKLLWKKLPWGKNYHRRFTVLNYDFFIVNLFGV